MAILRNKKNQNIDLLTEEEESSKSSGNKLFLVLFCSGFVVFLLVLFGALTLLNTITTNNLNSLKQQNDTAAAEGLVKFQNLAVNIKSVKGKLQDYDQLIAKYAGFDKKFENLSNLLPATISLMTLDINSQNRVLLKGKVRNPEDAYQFYQVLQVNSLVSGLSLDTLTKVNSDYVFDLSFVLKVK